MRIVQRLILFILGLALVAGGLLLAWFPVSTLYQLFVAKVAISNDVWRIAVGCAAAAIGVFAILPFGRRGHGRKISFQGPHGDIVIQLDGVENSLRKVIGKLPTVKKVAVQLLPDENSRRVRVKADALLTKAGGASTRESTVRLSEDIARCAKQLLGMDEVAGVDLNIDGIDVDPKSFKEPMGMPPLEPVLPSAPARETRAPIIEERKAEVLPRFMEPTKPEPAAPVRPGYDAPLRLADDEKIEEEPELEPDTEDEDHADTSFSTLSAHDSGEASETEKHGN